MAYNESKNARIKATGRIIKVYKHTQRGTWVDCDNCSQEYEASQLEFLNG